MEHINKDRTLIFNEAINLSIDKNQKELHEALVLAYTNPNQEWGHNNLRDLVTLYKDSGKTDEQIYNILYMLGLEKETAYDAVKMYGNEINNEHMSERKALDFTKDVKSLIEKLESSKTEDRVDFSVDEVIIECRKYIVEKQGIESSVGLSNLARKHVRNIKQYDYIDAVAEHIKHVENSMIVEANNTISNKFNLEGRIKALSKNIENIKTNSSVNIVEHVKQVCDSALVALKSNDTRVTESAIAQTIYNNLYQYNWLKEVSESLDSMVKFIGDNMMSFEVNNVLESMALNSDKNFYAQGIEKLEEIRNLNESEIRDSIKYGMQHLTWIPQIKYLVQRNNQVLGELNENYASNVNTKFSPFLEKEGIKYFYLDGKIYGTKDNEIVEGRREDISQEFLNGIYLVENAIFGKGTITLYNNSEVLHLIKEGENTIFKINEKVIPLKDANEMRTFLFNARMFKPSETHIIEALANAFENMNSFVELDFVTSVQSKRDSSNIQNVIKLNENIYINTVNKTLMKNEMVKVKNIDEAIKLVKESVNFDISERFSEEINEQERIRVEKETRREGLFEKINFLNEQVEKLDATGLNTVEINEARKMLEDEIETFKKEVNTIV